ncbi:hypothetical protein BGZ58_005835 [Dissophora ornata]|nr:hypothetical protein BGZ58_005835 [Dissophora ornata]
MERLKRARHRSAAAQEDVTSANDDHAEYTGGDQQLSWQDRKEHPVRPSEQGAMSLHPLKHVDNSQPHNAVQVARIHPLDNEPIATSVRTGIVTRKVSSIPNAAHLSRVKPSIHPLDTGVSLEAAAIESQKHGAKNIETSGTVTSATTTNDEVPKHAVELSSHSVSVDMHRDEATAHTQTQQRTKAQDSVQIKKDAATGAASSRSATSALSKPAPVPSLAPNPATLALPITRETLRELDMPEIFNNPQLRHDIVFDPHLQFRPNFDGDRGIAKRREADRFWREVGLELNGRRSILETRREATTTMLNATGLSSSSPTSRLIQQHAQQMYPLPDAVLLPRLIDELREILLSLLPPPSAAPIQDGGIPPATPERALLSSTLDPDLLIQELDHGVLDVHALFRFLGDSLKGHCAPMRDAFVESMVTIVVDSNEIVRGIRMCFEILEWMKLDIANHQLRTLRPWLLNNSIEFEQKYFTQLLTRAGTLNRTTEWFKRSWIQWESVKRSVIGQQPPVNELSGVGSRRSSVALATAVYESEQSGNESRMVSSTTSSFTAKRRPSIVRPDIGENILDGVVNEGLLEMILCPHESVSTMPDTFELDFYRLRLFHNDFQDLTILCVLLILFRQLAHSCWTQQDLVEIKKVVWLLLMDENADFGANTNPGPGADAAAASTSASGKDGPDAGSSSGMKDIVIQIEFAARKVRDRSKNGAASASASTSAFPAASGGPGRLVSEGNSSNNATNASASSASSISASGLCASDTNLLTAWLDNALSKTSTLYMLIQKRLLIHFRRWLYLHSSSSMMVLSASCASLASAMSMSSSNSAGDLGRTDEDEEDESCGASMARAQPGVTNKGDLKETPDREIANGNDEKEGNATPASESATGGVVQGQPSKNDAVSNTAASTTPAPAPAPAPTPQLSPEEANKAAAEALAAKLSFNAAEMEAHGLTGLEDEMTALLEKIRAVSEFNKKVYGSWYCDLVKQGRTENWLEKPSSSSSE